MPSYFRNKRKKLFTPIKKQIIDTVSVNSYTFNISDTGLINSQTVVQFPDGFRSSTANPSVTPPGFPPNSTIQPSGVQVWTRVAEPVSQDSVNMAGLAGELYFSFNPAGTGATVVSTAVRAPISGQVACAVVHVEQGQTPSRLTPFINGIQTIYNPQKNLLAYGVGSISESQFETMPWAYKFNIGTKRTLKTGDYIVVIYATNLPLTVGNGNNGGQVIVNVVGGIRYFTTPN